MTRLIHIVIAGCIFAGIQLPDDDEGLIASLKKLGGTFRRSECLPGNPVVYANFGGTSVQNKDLLILIKCKNLDAISLSNTSISDEGVKIIANISTISDLDLNETKITNASAKEICRMKSLKVLCLGGIKITDAGLKELAQLPLEFLILSDSGISDGGLMHLSKCEGLTSLSLDRTNVTDAGLAHLYSLKKLTFLSTIDSKVTNVGLQKLKQRLPRCSVAH